MTTIDEMFDTLRTNIRNRDAQATLASLVGMQEYLSSTKDLVFAAKITDPAIFTEIRTLLNDELQVGYKTTQLKGRVVNRLQRASLFLRALVSGVTRVTNG